MIKMLAVVTVTLLAACKEPERWSVVGLPDNAACGVSYNYVAQCVADGRLYTCVEDFARHRTACAPCAIVTAPEGAK